jgi:zinc finger FYVE domain-containing protein 26
VPIACPFSELGCTNELLPSEITEHVSAAVTDHLTLARDTIAKMNRTLDLCLTRIDALEKENVTLKQRVGELEVTRVNMPAISAPVPESITKLASAPKVVDEIAVEKEKIRQSKSPELELAKNNNNQSGAMTPVNKTPVVVEDDESIETGIKILMHLPSEMQTKYSKLIGRPLSIVENLLMDEKIEHAGKLIELLGHPKSEDLLHLYIKKALTVDSEGQTLDARVTLTGDYQTDLLLRTNFRYLRAPDVKLAKAMLDLLSDRHKAAYYCLELYQLYQSDYTYSPNVNHVTAIKLMDALRELLMYAKLQFVKSADSVNSGTAELCDSFVSHVDLFVSIVRAQAHVTVQLADFSESHKARKLRDKLIVEEKFEVARDVAVICGVEVDVVWVAWGLHRLRAGKYSAARDAFALCLVPADSTKKGNSFTGSKKSPAPNKSSIDSARVVDGIVAILDTSQHVSLPASHDDVSMDVSLGGDLRSSAPDSAKNRVANNSKDTQQRQQECIFYLERYGNTHSLLSYYLKHKLLEKACRHVIDRALSHATFVDYIVDHCLHVSLLPELKQMLKKIDPNMEVIKPYLLAACKYFNQKKAFKTLVTFQVFMKDYLRAGLTCIKIFMETLDPQYKLKCLEVAKGYFEEGLKLRQQTNSVKVSTEVSNEVLQESDVNKYLNRIDLQLELLQFLIPRYKDIAIEGFEQFTLFGNQLQRQALAEYVILHDVDLGIDVIDDAKLDRMSVLTASIANLGKSLIAAITNKTDPAAEMKRIDDFLTALKEPLSPAHSDALVLELIQLLAQQVPEERYCDKLIARLTDPRAQVRAHLCCGKLKAAYLLAVKLADLELIRALLAEAERVQSKNVVALCLKYLESRASTNNKNEVPNKRADLAPTM